MASFDKNKNTYDSETLRELLFTTILQNDTYKFADLCNRYASLIIRYFNDWRKVPQDIRQDPEEVNKWGSCLIAIANTFMSAGHPELVASLEGTNEANPIVQWDRACVSAQYLSERGRYKESNEALVEILKKMEGCVGSAKDEFRPKIYGLIGTNFFRINDLSKAREYTELALFECKRTGDRQGIAIYTENLAFCLVAAKPNALATQCRKQIAKAQDLSDQLRYEYSNKILREVLIDIEQFPELQCYRSKTYGLIGSNNFRLGNLQDAKQYTELAIQDCKKDVDDKGTRIYEDNLRVISKKIGEH